MISRTARASLEVASSAHRDVRVDGVELGEMPLRVRVMPGRHTVETADASGRFRRAGWVDARPPSRRASRSPPPSRAAAAGRQHGQPPPRARDRDRREPRTALALHARRGQERHRGSLVEIEISVDAAGAVRFLNVDSDLTSVTQTCIHDALAQIQFGAGTAATWRERIDL